MTDLISQYKEPGDKSGWDTDDMEQAQKIQDEILQLAKQQSTLNEDHAKKIDLQNGKYKEQLKAAHTDLIQSKDAQGA